MLESRRIVDAVTYFRITTRMSPSVRVSNIAYQRIISGRMGRVYSQFHRQPIYEALAHQDGIHLLSRSTQNGVKQCTVAQLMRSPPQALCAQMSVGDAVEQTRPDRFRI